METPLLEMSAVEGGDPLLSPGSCGGTVCDVSDKWKVYGSVHPNYVTDGHCPYCFHFYSLKCQCWK